MVDPPRQNLYFENILLDLDPVSLDETIRGRGYRLLAGVDEAGRGPLAGPVVAAAVVLPPETVIHGLTDSKAVPPHRREALFEAVNEAAMSVGVGIIEAEEIDRINILQAALRAMEAAVAQLSPAPNAILIDGSTRISHKLPQFPIVKGDGRSQSIAAASIIAKVTRDRIMKYYHTLYPQYGFERHKGYATSAHLEALRKHGCSPIHRRTFRRVNPTEAHQPSFPWTP